MNVQANQIQQLNPDDYAQAQADIQKAKRMQALADSLSNQQYGTTTADAIAALVNGYARVKSSKQADETWSDAYKRASQYEQAEKEQQRAMEEAKRAKEMQESENSWRKRQEFLAAQDAERTKGDREYQGQVTNEQRGYNEKLDGIQHQRALEIAAAKKSAAAGQQLSDYDKEQLKSDLKIRNSLAEKALAAEKALPLIQTLRSQLESGNVDSGPIESRINPLNWGVFNSDQERFDIDARNLAEMGIKAKFGANVTDSEREAAYRNSVSTTNDEKTNLELLKRYEQELMDTINQFQSIDGSIKGQHSPQQGQSSIAGQEIKAPDQSIKVGKYTVEVN